MKIIIFFSILFVIALYMLSIYLPNNIKIDYKNTSGSELLIPENSDIEMQIKIELEKSNYCETKEDCLNIGEYCPFGCYIYVNKNEVDEMKNMISSFESNCKYDCGYCPDVACNNHKCEAIC